MLTGRDKAVIAKFCTAAVFGEDGSAARRVGVVQGIKIHGAVPPFYF